MSAPWLSLLRRQGTETDPDDVFEDTKYPPDGCVCLYVVPWSGRPDTVLAHCLIHGDGA